MLEIAAVSQEKSVGGAKPGVSLLLHDPCLSVEKAAFHRMQFRRRVCVCFSRHHKTFSWRAYSRHGGADARGDV